jgi:hypothetical protein
MAEEIRKNKIDDDQKRRAEHLKDKLEKQGVGQDEAEKRAMHTAVEEDQGSHGGGKSSGGDAKKDSSHVGHRRLGSDSNASK